MAITQITRSQQPTHIAWSMKDIRPGTFYDTADGLLVYAHIPSQLLIFDNPKRRTISLSSKKPTPAMLALFPMVRAKPGTSAMIVQTELDDVVGDDEEAQFGSDQVTDDMFDPKYDGVVD